MPESERIGATAERAWLDWFAIGAAVVLAVVLVAVVLLLTIP